MIKLIEIIQSTVHKGIPLFLVLCLVSCNVNIAHLCYDDEHHFSSDPWLPERIEGKLVVSERDMILAFEMRDTLVSETHCSASSGSEGTFRACHVIEFDSDSTCWDIWNSYKRGIYFTKSGSEFKTMIDSPIDTMYSNDTLYTNVVQLLDQEHRSLGGNSGIFMYKLFLVRIRCISYGEHIAFVPNFSRKFNNCQFVEYSTNYWSVVSFESKRPYFVSGSLWRFCN